MLTVPGGTTALGAGCKLLRIGLLPGAVGLGAAATSGVGLTAATAGDGEGVGSA